MRDSNRIFYRPYIPAVKRTKIMMTAVAVSLLMGLWGMRPCSAGAADPEADGEPAPELFSQIPSDYVFSSGVGAWWTEITIHPDGSFEGEYGDSDMGDSGEGYDSTYYSSVFYGKFVNPVKLADTVWSFELDSITYENNVGSTEITNAWGDDIRLREIYTDAYGIAGGTTFCLYAPGTPASDLPEEFVGWVDYAGSAFTEDGKTLSIYGIYNVDEQCGFSATSSEPGGHRYEVFLQNVTWEEAYLACQEKGGHLVRIETMDEYAQLLGELDSLGYRGCRLYLGGRRDLGGQQYCWVDDANALSGDVLNDPDAWCAGSWMAGEPSFRDETIAADEFVMELFYYGSENRWVWNDVPNNLPDYIGDAEGKLGYICEYDS